MIGLVVERWGPEVAPEGKIDRSAVARAAFAWEQEARMARAAALAARGGSGWRTWRAEQ